MAEEIVACPGCAKKFRIPEGADSGSFACTACGVDVPYGAAARKPAPAARPPARPAARPTAAAPRAAVAAARPVAVTTTRRTRAPGARAGHGRHPARHESDKPKSNTGLIWGSIAVGGILLIAIVWIVSKPKPTPIDSTASTTAAKPAEPPKPTPPKPAAPAKPDPPASTAAATKPSDASVVPDAPSTSVGTQPAAQQPKADTPPVKPVAKRDNAVLGQTFASVAGTTAEEREELDKLVRLAMDQGSGKEGANAETTLVRKGKKSIPSLLSAFSTQYTGGKWASDAEQWSADKIQDLLHRITGADCIYPDFWPKFMSGASPGDFEKAATLWVQWWQKAQFKEKFKRAGDEK